MKKYLVIVGKDPFIIVFAFLTICIIYDCIAHYNEYSTWEFLKTAGLGLLFIWGVWSKLKS
jgi:hypothetical protein